MINNASDHHRRHRRAGMAPSLKKPIHVSIENNCASQKRVSIDAALMKSPKSSRLTARTPYSFVENLLRKQFKEEILIMKTHNRSWLIFTNQTFADNQ